MRTPTCVQTNSDKLKTRNFLLLFPLIKPSRTHDVFLSYLAARYEKQISSWRTYCLLLLFAAWEGREGNGKFISLEIFCVLMKGLKSLIMDKNEEFAGQNLFLGITKFVAAEEEYGEFSVLKFRPEIVL